MKDTKWKQNERIADIDLRPKLDFKEKIINAHECVIWEFDLHEQYKFVPVMRIQGTHDGDCENYYIKTCDIEKIKGDNQLGLRVISLIHNHRIFFYRLDGDPINYTYMFLRACKNIKGLFRYPNFEEIEVNN